jgi:hypothetical protein
MTQEEFTDLLKSTKRRHIETLITYLETETDFFSAPASSNYHGAEAGGLLSHSIAVYTELDKLVKLYKYPVSPESVIIISLLHDICKANFYERTMKSRPMRNDEGNLILDKYGKKTWEETESYTINDKCPLGHGEKSAIIIQNYIQLTMEEVMGIRWHMMAYDDVVKGYTGNCALTAALNMYPIISLVHCADLLSISHQAP